MESYLEGKCMEMCPFDETQMRVREKLVHVLEKEPFHMVKAFSRSAAGKQITELSLRPPSVLLRTVTYLLCNVLTSKTIPFYAICEFITDRLLAVRQDMVVQNISAAESITILQPIVRFHAFVSYKLCDEAVGNFDPVLNNNHLQECLKKLLNCYDVYDYLLNSDANCNNYIIESRPTFEALYVVFNLGSEEALQRSVTIPKACRTSLVATAVRISLCHKFGNYVRVCRLIRKLPSLLATVAALHLPKIRKKGFQVMSVAYHNKNLSFPLKTLKDIFLYGLERDVVQDCEYFGIGVENDRVFFSKQGFDLRKCERNPKHELFIEEMCLEENLQNIILGS